MQDSEKIIKYCRDIGLEYFNLDLLRGGRSVREAIDFYRPYLPADIICGIRDMLETNPYLLRRVKSRIQRFGKQHSVIQSDLVLILYFIVYATPYVACKTWRWDQRIFHMICNDLKMDGLSYPLGV